MALLDIDLSNRPVDRVLFEDVLGELGGASARGSTYWRRVQLCPREHLLANRLGWQRTPRADALDLGLLWHKMLEVYYEQRRLEQAGQRFTETAEQAAYRLLQRFRDPKGWGAFYESAQRMFEAYQERWRYADRDWQIIGVEITGGWTMESHPEIVRQAGFELTTRFDMLVVDHSLPTIPVTRHIETKSAHALDPQTVIAYSQDDQVLGQCFLGRYFFDWKAVGYPPYVGALVNVTTKAKTPRCERLPVQPSDATLQAFAESKRFWASQRDTYERIEAYPRNYVNCTRRFGRCEFHELCREFPDVTIAQLTAKDIEPPVGYALKNGGLRP